MLPEGKEIKEVEGWASLDSIYSNLSLSSCGNRNSEKLQSRRMEQKENWGQKNQMHLPAVTGMTSVICLDTGTLLLRRDLPRLLQAMWKPGKPHVTFRILGGIADTCWHCDCKCRCRLNFLCLLLPPVQLSISDPHN